MEVSTCLAFVGCILLASVSGANAFKPSEGTSFACALPRTYHDFDGLVRLVSKEGAAVTILTANETREVAVPAGGAVSETFSMAQRVSHGVENLGIIITSDSPISVYLEQPSWEVDAALCRPTAAEDTEFYAVAYLGEEIYDSLYPLSFFYIVASDDDTTVTITDREGDSFDVELNLLDVYTEDAVEAGIDDGPYIDFTGWHISSDKPVSVFAGHGRVVVEGGATYAQYIIDSMPAVAELGTSYTTFPIGMGANNAGYVLRVLATVDGTQVTIEDLGVSETVDAGQYHELRHGTSYSAFKVECSAPCYVLQLPSPTFENGGDLDTTMGSASVPLTPDSAFSSDLLVVEPFRYDLESSYAMISIVANTYPVSEIYYNGQNVNDLATWVAGTGDAYAYTAITVSPGEMVRLTSEDSGELFAAYIYNNDDGEARGSKAYSAGYS